MLPGQTEKVRAELLLIHKGVEYTIVSEQQYRKTDKNDKPVEAVGQRSFTIMYKQNGQIEYVKPTQLDGRMKEILPSELARYFFFDGERITAMSKRLSQGKGEEFARAVRSLLGLDAFTSAIEHLKKAVREYDKRYDAHSDSKIGDYTRQIAKFETQIEDIETRLAEIEHEEVPVTEKISELQTAIEKNKMSAQLAESKKKLIARREVLIAQKERNVSGLLSTLKHAPYFAKKLMYDSLHQLKETRKTEKSVPNVNAQTIKHLIERGRCICGAEVCTGNDAYIELTNLFSYVPPKSIGDSISDFRDKCKERVRGSESMFADFKSKYADVCAFDSEFADIEQDILDIEKQLLGMNADVGKMQADIMRYQTQFRNLRAERSEKERCRGGLETDCKRIESERDKLTLKDDNNRRVMIYKAYAQHMYDELRVQYANEEQLMRKTLEQTVNEIFHSILGEGFSLELNEKYDVQITLSDLGGSTETSTAQNISIIFAFIAGVIQMARESQEKDGGLSVSEPYPLVMDAPLSSFDKTRIQTVCDVLPKIAEQVIIFIKDADGEFAEGHLGNRIGKRLSFNAVNGSKIETKIEPNFS